jgi:hypothetical protein
MPGVTGDRDNLYVTIDGDLKVYRKTTPLQLVRTEEVAAFQLGGPEVVGNDLYVSRGTHAWTADGEHVFMSTLNEGDAVRGFRKRTLSPTLTYGEAFVPQKTVIYDRRTAQPVFAIPDPLGIFGRLASPRLSVDPKYLFRTIPGCCGKLVEIFDAHTFEHIQDINRQAANTVTRRGRWLIVGDEFGTVSLWDVGPICQRDGGRLSMARHSKKSARVDGSGTFVAPTPLFNSRGLEAGQSGGTQRSGMDKAGMRRCGSRLSRTLGWLRGDRLRRLSCDAVPLRG